MIIVLIIFILIIILLKISLYRDPKEIKKILDNIYNRSIDRFNGLSQCDFYCMYLPKRESYIQSVLNQIPFSICYFKSITPNDISNEEYNSLVFTKTYRKTVLACMLSFTMCAIDALRNKKDVFGLFEDDIKINEKANLEELSGCIDEFKQSEFDVLYLGYCKLNCNQNFKPLSKYQYLYSVPNKSILCNHAIMIKTNILPSMIKDFYPMVFAHDFQQIRFYKKNNIKICIPKIPFFIQNKEDVTSELRPIWHKFENKLRNYSWFKNNYFNNTKYCTLGHKS